MMQTAAQPRLSGPASEIQKYGTSGQPALGLRHVAVAVTKMDLVGYVEEPFRTIESDIRALGEGLGVPDVLCIPVSGLRGDNVVASSARMPWYGGTTLMQYLETIEIEDEHVSASPLRFFVQWISRDGAGARGLCGTVVGGSVALGDPVVVLPSGRESRIARIATYDGDLDLAVTGQSVTLMLEDEIDVSRGDLISAKAEPAGVADQFEATVVWMADDPLLPGRNYLMRVGTQSAM